MDSFRLGRELYLAAWAGSCALQGWLFSTYVLADQKALGMGLILLVQLLKTPLTVGRLNDLGRSASEAILGLVPLVNVGLWYQIGLKATPSDAARAKQLAKWSDEPTPVGAFVWGLRSMLRVLPLVVVLSIAWAAAHTFFGYLLVDWVLFLQAEHVAGRGEFAESVRGGLIGLAGLLVLYTAMQYPKRATASRASWIPSLFTLPVLAAAGALYMIESGGPIPGVLMFTAFDIAWVCVMDAALVVVYVTAADLMHRGEQPTVGKLISAMGSRTWDVAAPFGGSWTAILVGLQVVIPGIHYALQYSLVAAVAVLEPEQPALTRSTALTRPIRRRLFVLLYMGFALTFGMQCTLVYQLDGWEVLMQFFIIPTVISERAAMVGESFGNIVWAITTMGLVLIYKSRAEKLPAPPVGGPTAASAGGLAESVGPPTP